jgi:hypothetical protein
MPWTKLSFSILVVETSIWTSTHWHKIDPEISICYVPSPAAGRLEEGAVLHDSEEGLLVHTITSGI